MSDTTFENILTFIWTLILAAGVVAASVYLFGDMLTKKERQYLVEYAILTNSNKNTITLTNLSLEQYSTLRMHKILK